MTNKPEVLGFFVEWSCNNEEGEFKLSLDHFTTRDDYCSIFGGGCRLVPVIRLSDYETLQAECEKLRCIISDLKDWDCDVGGGFLSIPVDLRRRMQEAIDAAMEGVQP